MLTVLWWVLVARTVGSAVCEVVVVKPFTAERTPVGRLFGLLLDVAALWVLLQLRVAL